MTSSERRDVRIEKLQEQVSSFEFHALTVAVRWGLTGALIRKTPPLASSAGAGVLVAGSSFFGDNLGVAIAMGRLRASIALHKNSLQA
jgi:hypothetical protein